MIWTWHRRILNKLPNPKTIEKIKSLSEYEPRSMGTSLPIIWKKAKGHSVWDYFGNKFIDFSSTIFVTNTGHGAIAKAIKKQADNLIHCYTYANEPRIELIARLNFMLFMYFYPYLSNKKESIKIYLASAGSEVTDWAIKLMRNSNKKRVGYKMTPTYN